MSAPKLLEAWPLTWPERQQRTVPHQRRHSRFEVGFATARDHVLNELKRLGAKDVVISSNVRTRRDGLPLADEREPNDPGIAVYFERRVRGAWVSFVIACDSYNKVKANLRAVGLTVDSLRAIERHGCTELLEQAFRGFAALPAHVPDPPWWEVLGVSQDANADAVREAFRRLAFEHHPDRGGDRARFEAINKAANTAYARAS